MGEISTTITNPTILIQNSSRDIEDKLTLFGGNGRIA
jgi:hypothetical protein